MCYTIVRKGVDPGTLLSMMQGKRGILMATNLVITIGRQFGSGGRKVGKLLAETLDIP